MTIPRSVLTGSILWLLVLALTIFIAKPISVFGLSKSQNPSFAFPEGKVVSSVITVGPFDLHRKYRSMEGPYAICRLKVGDIVASKRIEIPEGMVNFVESGKSAPAMMDSSPGQALNSTLRGLVDTSNRPRTLLWFKGIKLEVLDENDHVLPTAEFICHSNIDTNPNFRNQIFTEAERCPTGRLITITQGQTEIAFPVGYGVPVASDEPWTIGFQAANRTTEKHRRVKHRCTLYFIKDKDLVYPITALNWFTPIVYVSIDNNSAQLKKEEKTDCLSCLGTSPGVNAPNNVSNGTFADRKGHRMSGHWVVPPGDHTYSATINDDMDPGFAFKPRALHAVWSHVHPLCSNVTLYECKDRLRTKVFSVASSTETKHGLEIKNIDYWSSRKGIRLPTKSNYELEVSYKNSTNVPQDSMCSTGMFFEDTRFARPAWVFAGKDGYSCMVGANNSHERKDETIKAPIVTTVLSRAEPARIEADPNLARNLQTMIMTVSFIIGGIILIVLLLKLFRTRK